LKLLDDGCSAEEALRRITEKVAHDKNIKKKSITCGSISLRYETDEGFLFAIHDLRNRVGYPIEDRVVPVPDISVPKDTKCCCKALVLAPYFSEFEPKNGGNGDEANDIAKLLRKVGCEVCDKYDKDATADYFKTFGDYDLVVVTSHGAAVEGSGETMYVLTSQPISEDYYQDLKEKRIGIVPQGPGCDTGGYMHLYPSFFEKYNKPKEGQIVYFGACDLAKQQQFSEVFSGLGAAAYSSYTLEVTNPFAAPIGVDLVSELVQGSTVGEFFSSVADERDVTGAEYESAPPSDATLECNL
jgi:hypothetical protein